MIDAWTALWSAPAAVGFAMMFNIRRSRLIPVAVIAVGARLLSDVCVNSGLSIVAADYLAAFAVGLVAFWLAPATRSAAPVYAFAPIIPLFPGKYAIAALQALVDWIVTDPNGPDAEARFTTAAASGFTAVAIMLALCLGAISPVLLMPWSRRADA